MREKRHKEHRLKRNKTQRIPKHWFFFDVETTPEEVNEFFHVHPFRVACVELCYFDLDKNYKRVSSYIFRSPKKLAEFLDKAGKKRSSLMCLSLNLSYDVLTTHLFYFLSSHQH